MITLTASAHCHACPWTTTGPPTDVDKAADKHTSPGHPTATVITP